MSYATAAKYTVEDENLANLQRWQDKFGTENLTILGSKTLEVKARYDCDDLIVYEFDDRDLSARIATPGSGKTVSSGFHAFLHHLRGCPFIAEDTKREYARSVAPLHSSRSAIDRLRALGFKPQGLSRMKFLSPLFLSSNDGIKAGVPIRAIMELDDDIRYDIFERILSGRDTPSEATVRGIDYIFNELSKRSGTWDSPAYLDTFFKEYRTKMIDRDAKSAAGTSLSGTILNLLHGRFFEGERIELDKWFKLERPIDEIILETTNIFSSDLRTVKFNLFLLALLYDLRRKNKIPPVIKITEEADVRLSDPIESKGIELELNKMRTQGNHNIFVLQNLEKVPSFMGALDCLITGKLGEKDVERLRNFSSAENLHHAEHLNAHVKPRELFMVTKEYAKSFYSFPCPWEFPKA